MAYVIKSLDTSALGYGNKGVVCPTFSISALADLAEDSEILNAPAGSTWVLANTLATGSKDPLTKHWVLPDLTPILITTQPVDVSTTAGAITESLSVVAYSHDSSGNRAITYQWYSNNSEDYTSPTSVEGATSATMVLNTELAEGTYYYFCTLTSNSKTLDTAISTVTVAAGEGPS